MISLKRVVESVAVALVMAASFLVAPATAQADPNCPYLWICIWDGFNYNNHKHSWTVCTFVNIGSLGWSDRLRAFKNNQSPGTVTTFYNWNGRSWEYLDRSVAPEFIPVVNFPLRTTDAIQIC